MRFTRPQDAKRQRSVVIDIAPLVDIVFQLLIFFMLAASFVRNPVLDINLPKASARPKVQPKGAVTVYILREGRADRFRVDERVVNETELKDVLGRRFADDPRTVLLIQADERVPHGDVVKVMSLGQEVGLVRQGIVASSEAPAEGAPP
ncbi:MAG: biopolymer transporter ExbD [Deltaproteobacteria bacterium]|nr:biopolymer transporter ExbD [Deltaproteobacteria bacterium]